MPSKTTARIFSKTSAAVLVGIIAIFISTLHSMGRVAWYSGGFGLWTFHAWSKETSQLLGDPYSTSHIIHGFLFFGFLLFVARRIPLEWRLIIAALIEVGWELLENSPIIINRYREGTASLDYFGDSILNSFGDVMFCVIGFILAWKLPWKVTVLIGVIIEIVMLFTVKDNLTLNILMLIYPIQAIKQWQVGT